jgi:hypothetical protein
MRIEVLEAKGTASKDERNKYKMVSIKLLIKVCVAQW